MAHKTLDIHECHLIGISLESRATVDYCITSQARDLREPGAAAAHPPLRKNCSASPKDCGYVPVTTSN